MSAVVSQDNALASYRAAFESRWSGDDALTRFKRDALTRFLDTGFPTPRQEDWKYTNLRRLQSRTFSLSESALTAVTEDARWITHRGPRVVFVNGIWMPSLSTNAQPPGTTLVTLGQWMQSRPDALLEFMTAHAPKQPTELENLNDALFQDGVVVEVSAGVTLEEPIYILHVSTAQAAQRMSHPRVLVRAGAQSRCTIVEHYLGVDEIEYFNNVVANIEVGAAANVVHCRVQQESTRAFHLATSRVSVARDASYHAHDIALGASLARIGIDVALHEPNASVSLRGLFAPRGSQHHDSHTRIDHIAPHTQSLEEYHGIADDRGRGVFNGKVVVHPNAQRIDARQSSRNLLLSTTAEIDTKPELEIYADDVKCSHGATTGQLDATALFYLRSRGLSEADARTALIRAFAHSVLTTIPCQSAREHLDAHIDERFGAGVQP